MVEIHAESISALSHTALQYGEYEYVFTIAEHGTDHLVHVPPEVMERFFVDCFRKLRPRFHGFLETNNQYREYNLDLLKVLGTKDTIDVLQRIIPRRP